MLNSHTKLGRRAQRVPVAISYSILGLSIVAIGYLMFFDNPIWEMMINFQLLILEDSYYPVLNILVVVLLTVGPAMGIIHIIASFYPKSEVEVLFEERESS